MIERIKKYDLSIDKNLYNFINLEVLPDTNINKENFWKGFSNLVSNFYPINKKLLFKRDTIQKKINEWHKINNDKEIDYSSYKDFLYEIEYLVKEGPDFKIDTNNVDPEISSISGPQLVVPITNARYSLNAVNARWGSLYDALYGSDVIESISKSKSYDPNRGLKVIKYAKSHLDKFAPIENSSWEKIIKIELKDKILKLFFSKSSYSHLLDPSQIVGYKFNKDNLIEELVLIKNNLHCRIIFDPNHNVGKSDPINISDIILESAISTILDCEDSIAAVDTDDKILAYRNWLGLMKGNLETKFIKNDKKINRSLNEDIEIKTVDGNTKILKGRSLMLIRNVGHLMTTSSILNKEGKEIGEGLMDSIVTSLIALHDLKKSNNNKKNSLYNSIYIVKPKMHGPEEVKFTNDIFQYVEEILNLPINTIKIGIMDEERRTSVNLKECIRSAKSRVAFINTGFLDRTGDEIYTSMYAGPFINKNMMKSCDWIKAYEERNVQIGLECGLQGRAQIGKGMWAMPDLMSEMINTKIAHLKAGANCAWVPSPTAATLHSMHYHQVNVINIQNEIIKKGIKTNLNNLITLPLLRGKNLSEEEINSEIENNAQGILGYVVRWIDQGIGCSKVPDINNIGLMEDRATCRISSQSLVNWILHDIVSKDKVEKSLKKMAQIVDNQNEHDPNYIKMSPDFNTLAFKAAQDLIFEGLNQPSGYTEPILHKRRLQIKNLNNS